VALRHFIQSSLDSALALETSKLIANAIAALANAQHALPLTQHPQPQPAAA
jgi:hypothetical protein